MNDKLNIHLYIGSTKNSSRILKEAAVISHVNNNIKIIVTSIANDGEDKFSQINDRVWVEEFYLYFLRFKKTIVVDILKYIEFSFKVFFKYRGVKIDYLNVHSLNLLFIGVGLKFFGKVDCLIYDPHELETERVGLSGVPKLISKILEKKLVKFIDRQIVVCQPIAAWYQKAYGIENILVVRNIPKRQDAYKKSNALRVELGINNDDLIFIYQGVISRARGIFEIIATFKIVEPGRHVVFMGYGPDVDFVKQCAQQFGNIHYLAAVAPRDVIAYTSGADVGLNFIMGDICMSYRYSLPNKFYEYLYAGCCVLVSKNLEYLTNVINNENLGWSVDGDAESLFSIINSLSRDEILQKKENIINYIEENCWEDDAAAYGLIYS